MCMIRVRGSHFVILTHGEHWQVLLDTWVSHTAWTWARRTCNHIFQDSGTSFHIHFYISLDRATVPVRINIITSLQWPSFFGGRSLCSLPHFLVVLATAIKLKSQEVKGLCLSLRRRESCWLRYRFWLLVSTGWQHCFWVRSQLSTPLGPLVPCPLPPTPPYKISTYF